MSQYIGIDGHNAGMQVVEATTANGVCTIRIKATALPGPVATALDENADLIRMTLAATNSSANEGRTDDTTTSPSDDAAETSTNGDTDTTHTEQQTQNSMAGTAAGQSNGSSPAASNIADTTAQLSAIDAPSSAAPEASQAAADNGNSSQQPPHSAAEALSDAGRGTGSQPGSADPSQGGQEPAGELSGIDGTRGRAMGINDNGDASSSQEEEGSLASGKVGILKQRLIAAAKEAKAGPPDLLKVSHAQQQ